MSYAPVPALTQLSRGHIDGFITSIGTDTEHDIDIAVGSARDSSNGSDIKTSSVITKQLDVDWVAGSAAGGFPSGLTLAVDTWYHMFMILNNDMVTVDAGFDSSITATNLLTDASTYTDFRRIGSVLTNGSSNIIAYKQYEDRFIWDVMVQDISNQNFGSSVQTMALSVPPDVQVWADITMVFREGSSSTRRFGTYGTGDMSLSGVTPSASLQDFDKKGSDQIAPNLGLLLKTDTSSQVKFKANSTGSDGFVKVMTHGWEDPRGKQ
jgi:hypothetical protein